MKIGIIGAGVAGLAAAVRMASRGYEVHVFETNDYPGGKLSAFTLPSKAFLTEGGYRFDAGPSLFTMPQYVEDIFKKAQVPIEPYFQYDKMDVVCQYFWEDGTQLTAFADPDRLAEEVTTQLKTDGQLIKKALRLAKRKYEQVGSIFLENSLHKIGTWLQPKVMKAMMLMPSYDIFKSMNKTHGQIVNQNPKLVQLLNRFATYNGSNPYRASGMLSVIPHFEHGIGCFYPRGGMYEITQAIFKLAQLRGVHFYFNQKINQIIVEKGKAIGLKKEGSDTVLHFDRIISNMDVYFTYKKLMPDQPQPERTLNQERSTSALIFYWGIKKTFPVLHLHNIFFSKDYKQEFDALDKGEVSDDPTVYINITSKMTPTDAPDGCENWFVMVNVPHNSGQNWAQLTKRIRHNILSKISKRLGTDIENLIDAEDVLTPLSIEAKTQSYAGALYGTSSNALMSAFLRHPNFSSAIKNLYFVGGSVHPGGGIPLALLSAKIVDEVMKE